MIENKLGIKDSAELARQEERISKQAAVQMYDSGFLDSLPAGSFESLAAIHKRLFGEIYDFAGKLRTLNIAKGNFRFASVIYLEAAVENIEKMPQSTFDDIVEKYVEMNAAHPFREGNGRAMRIWLDCMLKSELKKAVDWSRVDKDEYLIAMERSPVKDTEIKTVIGNALTENTDDRELYMKGIDNSYFYEGYSVYKTKEL